MSEANSSAHQASATVAVNCSRSQRTSCSAGQVLAARNRLPLSQRLSDTLFDRAHACGETYRLKSAPLPASFRVSQPTNSTSEMAREPLAPEFDDFQGDRSRDKGSKASATHPDDFLTAFQKNRCFLFH
jgi:hypothetical protein